MESLATRGRPGHVHFMERKMILVTSDLAMAPSLKGKFLVLAHSRDIIKEDRRLHYHRLQLVFRPYLVAVWK